MLSRKIRMRILDRLASAAGHTLAVSVAIAAGVVSGTITLVDNVLDHVPAPKSDTQKK